MDESVELRPPSRSPPAPARPADVPEKFWDEAAGTVRRSTALLKSYIELERKLGAGRPTAAAELADPVIASAPLEAAAAARPDPDGYAIDVAAIR